MAGSSIACAQVSAFKTDSIYAALPATKEGIHIRFRKDHWERLDLANGTLEQYHMPGIGKMTQYFRPILLKQGIFLVHELGGLVYRVNEDSVWRIDKSFDHRMQNHSIIFQKNDTILRHGGYGFWSARQLIVYFDITSGNWEPYRYKPGGNVPPGFSGHQYILRGDSLIIFGGLMVDPSDPLMPRPNDQVWCYLFSSLEWSYLGKVNWADWGYVRDQIPTIQIEHDQYLISSIETLSVQTENNSIARHKLSDKIRFWVMLPNVVPFTWNDRLYFYRHKPKVWNDYELQYIPTSELLSTPLEEHEWVQQEQIINLNMVYFTSFALVVMAALVTFRKKLKRGHPKNLNKPNRLDLEPHETKLLKAFMDFYPKSLLVTEIDTALETSRKSRDVQNQRRSQVIRSVNTKFMVYAQTDSTLILSKRSETDGRMVEYFIDPEWYEVLVKGLGMRADSAGEQKVAFR